MVAFLNILPTPTPGTFSFNPSSGLPLPSPGCSGFFIGHSDWLKSRTFSLPFTWFFLSRFLILPFRSCRSYGVQSGRGSIRIMPGIFLAQPRQPAALAERRNARRGRASGRDGARREGRCPPPRRSPCGAAGQRGAQRARGAREDINRQGGTPPQSLESPPARLSKTVPRRKLRAAGERKTLRKHHVIY